MFTHPVNHFPPVRVETVSAYFTYDNCYSPPSPASRVPCRRPFIPLASISAPPRRHLTHDHTAPVPAISRLSRRVLLLTLAVSLVGWSANLSAQGVDVIRGRVTGQDSLPLENVVVTVTSMSGNVNRLARTDRSGRFTVTFPGGDGDYMVSMTALGYSVKRFEIKRVADEDILLADAKLTRVGALLDAVKVTAERQKVTRNEANAPDISGTEQRVEAAAIPPDAMGDLAAMAASLPGVQLVPGQDGSANGFSVLGLGADQNNTTLNGLNFGGAGLPRDVNILSSLITAPYDVSRGGFSGGQFSIRTIAGSNFVRRNMSGIFDAPQLQWTDRIAQATGAEYTNLSLGGSVAGPVVYDKAFYNVSFQLGRQSRDLLSLLNTAPNGLQAAGVAPDSAQRFISLLNSSQIPTGYAGLPGSRLNDQGSVFGAIDFTPPSSNSGQAFNLTFNGNWGKQNPVATATTTALPTTFGERTSTGGGLQGKHSAYLRNILLTESSFGLSLSKNEGDPFVQLPAGRVRVNSTFDDGTSGVQTLVFGGNQNLATSITSSSASVQNALSWFSGNNKHRLKLTTELRRDGINQDQSTNQLGTFSYNSLADLQAGTPVSFTRSLIPRVRESSILVAGLSLGDSWRRTPNLQFQYGLRVDANRFLDAPNRNPEIERVFGVRNDITPDAVYLSPRIGFSWSYGTAPQIAAFDGAFRGPRAVVRGGVGMFQNTPNANLIGSAIDNTGLPGSAQNLTCIGPATPLANWSSYGNAASVPDRCADGTTGTVFSNSAPNVSLFADDYKAPRSVRTNLQWSGPVLKNRFSATVDGTFSYNMNQAGFYDRNFAANQRFVLSAEDNRPVFVLPSSIVPTTGGIAPSDARFDPAFAQVSEQRSNLSSLSRQLSFRLSPANFSSALSWSINYVYSNVREQVQGFNSTVADPRNIEWARSSFDSRHQLQYSFGYNFFDFLRVNWFGSFRSGLPFTPTIAGDVNGDGYANDRAFVFGPKSDAGSLLSQSMQTLLSSGSTAARDCLSSQLGKLAARNSCQGPWTTAANLSFSFNPLKIRLPQRASLSFSVQNPLGAADLLLHGENNLRGWGQNPFPDQSLLYVRGFDAVNNRYRYEVNQRFGATNPAFTSIRNPVILTAQLRYDIGPTRERQQLTQQLDRGRRHAGQIAPEQSIKAQYGTGGVLNPMASILRDQDTLKLSALQADSLASMNRRFTVRLDSIWSPIARDFAALPTDYAHDAVYQRYRRAREASVDMLMKLAPSVKDLLSKEQQRQLPAFVAQVLDTRYLASVRSGTAGAGGGSVFNIPGGGVFVGGGGGGGGGQQIIIRR